MSRPEHQLTVNANRPELMFWGCELVDMEVYLRLGWAQVLVLGPGLGRADWGYNLFKAVSLSDKPCVLDADALNLLSQEKRSQDNRVLTLIRGKPPGCWQRILLMSKPTGLQRLESCRLNMVVWYCSRARYSHL